jgi:disulfide oxidoreductase YuzD
MTNDFPDKLGVYRVGDLKFYSKLEAIEMMQKTGTHLHWDFNEAVFSSYDWTTEPTESLEELYRQRAQQIRDSYDYVILSLSGGPDSGNIFHTFIKNDIKLDEVVCKVNVEGDGNKLGLYSEEIFETAIPLVQKYQQKQNFKFRYLDITQMQLDLWASKTIKFDWIYELNMCWNPNGMLMRDWVMSVPEWADMIHSGKKVCVMHGSDKPRVFHKNDKFYFQFLDIIDNATTATAMAGKQPYADELFYWSPNFPKTIIKQAHMIKRYLSGNITQLPFCSLKTSNIACREFNGTKYWLSLDGLHTLIYPDWDPTAIVAKKYPSIIFGGRDIWFRNKLQEETVQLKNWKFGLDKWWKTLPDYWKNDPTQMGKSVKACISNPYFLE